MIIAILVYLIYFAIVLIANIAVIYHFSKYSFPGDITKTVVIFYSLLVIAVPVITLSMVGAISLR